MSHHTNRYVEFGTTTLKISYKPHNWPKIPKIHQFSTSILPLWVANLGQFGTSIGSITCILVLLIY